MESFSRCLTHVLKSEGGYVNDPRDPGGETNYGITVAVAREYGYRGPMKTIPPHIVANIYRELYWDKVEAGSLPYTMALHVFDAAVQHGPKKAIQLMQRALGIADDGIIGDKTRMTIRQMHPHHFAARFAAVRIKYYTDIKNFSTFGRGWMIRMSKVIAEAAQ